MIKQQIRFNVSDKDSSSPALCPCRVTVDQYGNMELFVEGYGTADSEVSKGPIAHLELWQGQLRLLVWPDIKNEEPLIIDLGQARESLR